MPLTMGLNLDGCAQIEDFTPLKDMAITHLQLCSYSRLKDLEFLRGMSLKTLMIPDTAVTDLTLLKGMQLKDIRLTPKNITQGLDMLRDMKSLKTIGTSWGDDKAWPAEQFWDRYDKGEFKE